MRTTTTREVEWDEQQQAWMLALALYRNRLCARGHYLPNTGAAEAEDRYWVEHPDRCHACTALLAAQAAYLDGSHAPHPGALIWHAERR